MPRPAAVVGAICNRDGNTSGFSVVPSRLQAAPTGTCEPFAIATAATGMIATSSRSRGAWVTPTVSVLPRRCTSEVAEPVANRVRRIFPIAVQVGTAPLAVNHPLSLSHHDSNQRHRAYPQGPARLAQPARHAAVPMGVPRPGAVRAGLPGAGQARQRRRAVGAEGHRRCLRRQAGAAVGAAREPARWPMVC